MDQLKELYKDPSHLEKTKDFPLAKMILLLSNNDAYCKSLKNVINDVEIFKDIVFEIIDQEKKKESDEYWNGWKDIGWKIGDPLLRGIGTGIGAGIGVGTVGKGAKLLSYLKLPSGWWKLVEFGRLKMFRSTENQLFIKDK